jgi:Bifunctional DNA primase/polymerase, N-terminal
MPVWRPAFASVARNLSSEESKMAPPEPPQRIYTTDSLPKGLREAAETPSVVIAFPRAAPPQRGVPDRYWPLIEQSLREYYAAEEASGQRRIVTLDSAYSPLQIAQDYLNEGWAPIPNPYRAKHPKIREWQNLIVTRDNLSQHFNNQPQNIGILLGRASGGLRDIDLDSPEAIALGKLFLPPTGAVFGRQSARCSHWLYNVDDVPDNIKTGVIAFNDPDKERILELRLGPGVQTIFPGSAHKDTGEAITWDRRGKLQDIPFVVLHKACAKIAAGALLIRYWPAKGARNEAALVLGGFLARCGWNEHEISEFVRAVAEMANDKEAQDRVRAAETAVDKLANGEPVAGLPRLKELFDDRVARQIAEWLGYNGQPDARLGTNAETPAPLAERKRSHR